MWKEKLYCLAAVVSPAQHGGEAEAEDGGSEGGFHGKGTAEGGGIGCESSGHGVIIGEWALVNQNDQAVTVQRTMVSTKTSTTPNSPCSTGLWASDAAWAVGEVPHPASLEMMPRMVPYRRARDRKKPRKPPAAPSTVKAPLMIPKEIRSKAMVSQAVLELTADMFDRARVSLWRAVRLDRRNAAAWYHLGYLSRDTYRFEDAALEQFQMASRLMTDPVRVKAVMQDIIPTIRESLRAKIAGKPGAATRDPGAAAKLVTEGEGLVKRDPKKAAAKFAEAYAKDPLSYAAAWNFAKAKDESAKSDADIARVLTAFQDAIDQRPNSQLTYRTAAQFALNKRRPIRAEKFLSQALAHDPEDKRSLGLYVQTLRRLGKTAEAKIYDMYLKEL